MSAFLEFLNTADLETLKTLPGMNNALAERMIAARPFATVEASLKVRGMGQNLLARLQAAFVEKVLPVAAESVEMLKPTKSAGQQRPTASGPGFGSRLGRAFVNFLRFLLILFIIFAVLAGIGAAIYFGLPYLNEKYVVPVEQNTALISQLATEQRGDVQNLKTQISDLQRQSADLQKQVAAAELRAADLEKSLAAHTETLTKLEKMQSVLDQAAAKQRDSLLVELKHQVMLTRAIEILSRGRLYLSQSNFGMAKVDVQSARNLLAALKADVPDYQVKTLDTVLARLDLALGNLPDFPVIAVDDVEIAWNLLIAGLPESAEAAAATPQPISTPTLTPTLAASPTPAPTLDLTPTLTPRP
jgi:hypothetical protein